MEGDTDRDQTVDDAENRLNPYANRVLPQNSVAVHESEAVLDQSDSVIKDPGGYFKRRSQPSEVGQECEIRSSDESERTIMCNQPESENKPSSCTDKNPDADTSSNSLEKNEGVFKPVLDLRNKTDDKEEAGLDRSIDFQRVAGTGKLDSSDHDQKPNKALSDVRTPLANNTELSDDQAGVCRRPASREKNSYGAIGSSGDSSKCLKDSGTLPVVPDGTAAENSSQETQFSFRRLSTRHKLTLFSIAFANFSAAAAFALLAPFFPQEAGKKEISQSLIGMIFGVYEFVIFISAPVLGSMITKVGAKFMFVSGVFVSGVCGGLFGTLDLCPPGITYAVMCFLTRSVEALGSSAVLVASFAIVAHEFPSNVATVFGLMETFAGFGMMVGPPLGGALYQLGGFKLPFFTLGGLLVACGLFCFWLLPIQNHREVPFEGSVLSLFLKPSACVITLSIITGSLALGFLDPTLANHFGQFDLSPLWIGLMFFLAPAVYALTAPLWGWIGDNKGYTTTMIVLGNFLSAVAFLLIGPAPFLSLPLELWLEVVSLILLGLFLGGALIPTFKALIDSANANGYPESFATYGIVSGLFNSAFSFGAFLGPTTLGGVVNDNLGFAWTACICALCLVVVDAVILLHICIRNQYHRLKDGTDTTGTVNETTPILQTQFSHSDVTGHQQYECA